MESEKCGRRAGRNLRAARFGKERKSYLLCSETNFWLVASHIQRIGRFATAVTAVAMLLVAVVVKAASGITVNSQELTAVAAHPTGIPHAVIALVPVM